MSLRAGYTVRSVILAIGILLFLGCEGTYSDLPSDREWVSDHFRYYSRGGDDSVCEQTLDSLERHFIVIQEYLGFEWNDGTRIKYYKFVDRDDYEQHGDCRETAEACMITSEGRAPTIHTYAPFQQHELVHAYLFDAGNPPLLLIEGMAEALASSLGEYKEKSIENLLSPSLSEALQTSSTGRRLVEGGWWVGDLLHRYEPDAVLQLYREWKKSDDFQTANRKAMDAFGVSAEETWAALRDLSIPQEVNVPVWQCEANSIDLPAEDVSLQASCEEPDMVRTFEVRAEADLLFRQNEENTFRIGSCDGLPVPSALLGDPFVDPHDIYVHLMPGRYYIEPEAALASATVNGSVLSSTVLSTDFSAIDTFVDTDAAVLHFPADGRAWYFGMHWNFGTDLNAPQKLFIESNWNNVADTVQVQLCSDAAEIPDSCETVDTNDWLFQESEEMLLRVTATPGRSPYNTMLVMRFEPQDGEEER